MGIDQNHSISDHKTEMKLPEKPEYGNWVSMSLIYRSGIAFAIFLVISLAAAYAGQPILAMVPALIAALSMLAMLYFIYARHLFSPAGRDVQGTIWERVLSELDWDGEGKALDIGCGSAPITIGLAKKYPGANITGIDYWGKGWEYSKSLCETNAAIEGTDSRITFRKASASDLPFEDETFDAVVSNLTFHEVKDIKDKREAIREALRVLKKGGRFVFQDLFMMKSVYGDPGELVKTIQSWGIKDVEFVETNDDKNIPGALKLPFMIGTLGIIKGKK